MGALSGSREPDPSFTGSGPSGFDPERWKLERYDAISTRILDGDGKVFAMIEQLTNGRWIVTTKAGTNIHGRSFASVKDAFAYQKAETAIAMETRRAETTGSVAKP